MRLEGKTALIAGRGAGIGCVDVSGTWLSDAGLKWGEA